MSPVCDRAGLPRHLPGPQHPIHAPFAEEDHAPDVKAHPAKLHQAAGQLRQVVVGDIAVVPRREKALQQRRVVGGQVDLVRGRGGVSGWPERFSRRPGANQRGGCLLGREAGLPISARVTLNAVGKRFLRRTRIRRGLPGKRLPLSHGMVVGLGDDPLSIGGEPRPVHGLGMALQRKDAPAEFDIPEFGAWRTGISARLRCPWKPQPPDAGRQG